MLSRAVRRGSYVTAQQAPRLPGVIVSLSPSLLEKVREKPYARDLFTVLYAVVIALQAGEWHRPSGSGS